MSRPKKLRTYVPEDKPELSPSDLLKTDKNILLVGKPGIGKTALCLEMMKVWAERHNKELDYMFYFDMRETSNYTKDLEDLLFKGFSEPEEGKEEVLQDIKKNSDNVTVIFDGVTDLRSSVVQRLADLLPDAKIIVTCRPEDEDDDFSDDFLRVEVKGFSDKIIKTYLSKTLDKELKNVSNNLELFTLCHVPMYALMVAAFSSSDQSPQPCTVTEIYINIVRSCLQMNSRTKTKHLNSFISSKSEEILSLAQVAFLACEGKTVNLTDLPCEDICVLSFLKPLVIKVAHTGEITRHAFLHYTMQEFFAAVWLLKNPDKIKDVFRQCLTEEKKHLKHLIPFMCRLLNEKSPTLMKCLTPAQELETTSKWFFQEVIHTLFLCPCDEEDTEDSGSDVDILFLCQCLYESQCPEACIYFLDKLDYHLDLSGQTLDPYYCCAVAYVITQLKEKKIQLNFEDVKVSDKGMSQLFGCLNHVQWCDPLPQQLWKIFLLSEEQMDHMSLLRLVFQSAPTVWSIDLSKRKSSILLEVLKLQAEKKPVELTGWSDEESEVRSFLQCLPHISQLSVRPWFRDSDQPRFFVNLFCAAAEREHQTGEKILEQLTSVCTYQTFPLNKEFMDDEDDDKKYQSDFLLDLFSHVKDYETKTGLTVLPSLQSVFQSAPTVWFIDLSKRKSSILLEVLKLQAEKKPVTLTGWSDEESEVRSFLQFSVPQSSDPAEEIRFFGNLFCAAAQREHQTGEKILEQLASVCTYQRFPLEDDYDPEYQSDFLLDLFSHVKDCETKTGLTVLPSLQSVLQSVPTVWFIDLSKRKSSILLEVLKLQAEKKPVELTGCSDEESEVRSFLQCLPHISQLSCAPDVFQRACTSIRVPSREEVQQLTSLLQLLGFTLTLTGELPRKTCCSVGTVLRVCGSDVDLTLTPTKMSARGAARLFRHTTQLQRLRLSTDVTTLLFQWITRGRVVCPLTVDELCLAPKTRQSHRGLLRVVSSLASLLRHWTVRHLDLTEFCVSAQCLCPLLLHDGPLTIKLSEENFQQLLLLLHEIQDKDLAWSFLSKVGGDLTSYRLNWEILDFVLQSSAQTFTVNMRKNRFLEENVTRLLPFLDRIIITRSSPRFVLAALRQVYNTQARPLIPSLVRSLGHVISLTCRELDSVDVAALIFTLRHSDSVRLNLVWTSIPAEEVQRILFTLDRVSHLSVDRNLLLRFIHCCAATDVQQEAASGLIRSLQHRLDLSSSSCVELPDQRQTETVSLSAADCRSMSTCLRHSSQDTQLDLRDCEVEDGGLELLFPVLTRVQLRASKAVLLRLVSLVPANSERDSVRRAESLCRSLDGELDLSHTPLDRRVCEALDLMLDFSEGLTQLDLSHCDLTDQLLLTFIKHLHKVHVLDLSHNKISDASTVRLLQLLSTDSSITAVRLFSNNIVDKTPFKKHKQLEIW
ncbi:hypothetical protein Q5P01_005904 [Channa striata]|uniref:NACHT domain-containing protein n=1 Tax=Channa striata TaxID=64152 RepID=A0AA88SZY0_CHASR|nr:hypothetical protein Q5P01_005904 [Channa striata]